MYVISTKVGAKWVERARALDLSDLTEKMGFLAQCGVNVLVTYEAKNAIQS